MGLLQKFQSWTSSHNPRWLALIRCALGVSLLLRGVSFLDNQHDLEKLLADSIFNTQSSWLVHAIPWIHISGGFLIILGLFTRFAAIVQVPVLLGAILFINAKKGIFAVETDLSFSVIILLLLGVFIIEGSGPISLAHFFKEDDDGLTPEEREQEKQQQQNS